LRKRKRRVTEIAAESRAKRVKIVILRGGHPKPQEERTLLERWDPPQGKEHRHEKERRNFDKSKDALDCSKNSGKLGDKRITFWAA